MDDDLKRGLLNKKVSNFDKSYQDCFIRIQRIKQKNDFMQKQIGTEDQESIRDQIQKQGEFIIKEIKELKAIMTEMQTRFKDPQSKNKLKKIKDQAQKQIERNKVILKDLIQKSFIARSHSDARDDKDYLEGGQTNYVHVDQNGVRREQDQGKQSILTDQHQIQIDFDLERKMMQEKNEMINEVQQATVRINDIMNDMAVEVDQQGQNLDVIDDHLMTTNKNLVSANDNLEEASTLQKKSKKKYLIALLILVVIIAVVVGFVFIFK